MFDLGTDPHPIASHLGRDRLLRRCSALLPGARPVGGWCPFEIAVRAVLGQGVRSSQATGLANRLARAFGPLRDEAAELGRLFPEAEDLVDADIERIGVPMGRARTLRALAAAVLSGSVCFDDSIDEVVRALQAIPGIGPWTSSYVALRGLGDPDAFPAEDAVLRRLAEPGRRLAVRELAERAERWRPWRSYAAAVLWQAGSLAP
jgi:AraC family transcriptional regulator of adaptative response / DNA-3-methyladenine glycosylase II